MCVWCSSDSGQTGSVQVLQSRRLLKPEMKSRRSDDDWSCLFSYCLMGGWGGGGGGGLAKSGSFGCTTVYVAPSKPPVSLPPRDPVISSPWRTSRLHSSIPSSPPPPHPFAQLHLHLSRTSPFHSSPHTVHRSALCNPSRGTQKPSPAFPSFSFSQRSSPGAHCRGAFQKERVMEVISDALTPLSAA